MLTEEEVARRNELIASLNPFIKEQSHALLNPDKAWQTSDILPDPSSREQTDQIEELRKEALRLPPSVLIDLIGNGITEDGLPIFTLTIGKYSHGKIVKDEDGTSPLEEWLQGWSAEENRHRDLINRYLYFVPAVNKRQVERTVHVYLRVGFDQDILTDPYASLIYPAWQERAAQEAHKGLAYLAGQLGADYLHRACGVMGGDEGRHGWGFYIPTVGEIFKEDPGPAIVTFWQMADLGIEMPGATMEGFNTFTDMSSFTGIFGLRKYVQIFGELIQAWDIRNLPVSGEAAKVQEAILRKFAVLSRLTEREIPISNRRIESPLLNTSSELLAGGRMELVRAS